MQLDLSLSEESTKTLHDDFEEFYEINKSNEKTMELISIDE